MRYFVRPFAIAMSVWFSSLSTGYAQETLFPADAFSSYSANKANGEYLFNASGCSSCHSSGEDTGLLSGGLKMETYVGTIYAPNITSHPNGIGKWSNANFLNAVINGVSPQGRSYYPVFPYKFYAGMKPEDVLDIKAYIEGLPQSDNKVPENEVGFPYNLEATMTFWKRANFNTPRWTLAEDTQMNRGKYLVESVGACGSCHTPRTLTLGIKEEEALAGTKGLTGAVAPAINKERLAALPSPDHFTQAALVEGRKFNGQQFADPIMRNIAKGTAKLTEEDRLAMLAYITQQKQEKKKEELTVVATCTTDTVQPVAASASAGGNPHDAAADEFIGKFCRNCHGPGESSQGSFPAGDLQSIAANAAFVTPGQPENSRLIKSITSGRMPIGSRPSDSEIQSISEWIKELGNPEKGGSSAIAAPAMMERKRDVVKRGDLIKAALSDLDKVNQKDRPFIRYFSYAYQFNGKFPCEDETQFGKRLDLYKAGFNKLLNSVSLGNSLVIPEAAEGANELMVRVDIRDLAWEDSDWGTLVSSYPFGIDPDSEPTLKALARETNTELPIMRTDWFMAHASSPKIYHSLLKLPENIADLEKTLGIDVNKNITDGRVNRAAFERGASGVSAHNRMIERHDAPQGGYYWKSYDMAGSFGLQNLKEHPHGPLELEPLAEGLTAFHHDGGEMIFSLPNGLQGYYLSTNKGDRLDDAPEKIVSYQERPKDKAPTIINGRSCFDCHADGILTKRDQMRDHISSSNLFSKSQQKYLLQMYIEQKDMDQLYENDRSRFVGALEKIGAVEAISGGFRSVPGPGNKEIVTWYADLYEANMDLEEIAAEFYMTAAEFEEAVPRVSDSAAQKILTSWVLQLEGGSKIPRFEIEQQMPFLVKPVLDLDPLKFTGQINAEYKEDNKDEIAEKQANLETKEAPVPQYKQETYVTGDKLELSVKVEKTDVNVGEKLVFEVSANKLCELQVVYVDSNQVIDLFPQQLLGDKILQPGEKRSIPVKASGEIVFDEPGFDESLILFCSEPNYKGEKFDKERALTLAKGSKKHATRGILIKLAKQVEESKGQAATHMVSYNVSK